MRNVSPITDTSEIAMLQRNRPAKSAITIVAAVLLVTLSASTARAQSVVQVKKIGERFELVRNGQPYEIRGVGGATQFELLASLGGNSIRTWSPDELDRILPLAEQNGLTVCVGLWLGHQRHGFNYEDRSAVEKQLQNMLSAVRKYKDHPAILMWGVGNEMEGDGADPLVWKAVNEVAREIKRVDPNHPTMTVIAELGDNATKIRSIEKYCPDVDIIGVNSYGGISSVAQRCAEAAGSKPYIVTEHGPIGPWEVGKTAWGAPLEATSTEKAEMFAEGYRATVLAQPDRCLGSYAFLWGNKQETTATWFGMLLPDGDRLGPVDAMSELWTGKPPANRCPRIESLSMDLKSPRLEPGATAVFKLDATDPENDPLTVRWVLRSDKGVIGTGGDAERNEATIPDAVAADDLMATVTAPDAGGGYRLFAYVSDGNGGAAVANTPFLVDAMQEIGPTPPAVDLPYVVYGDDAPPNVYAASGYMGNSTAVRMNENYQDSPHTGKTCLKVSYESNSAWGGVLWQSPANDWDGLQLGGADLTGASELEFWARGDSGGEVVNFVFGVLDGNQLYRDSAKGELNDVVLKDEWVRYRFPLTGLDLRRIKTGFGWSLAGQGKPVTFYLDDIRFVKK